jgi:hypothetical protein
MEALRRHARFARKYNKYKITDEALRLIEDAGRELSKLGVLVTDNRPAAFPEFRKYDEPAGSRPRPEISASAA